MKRKSILSLILVFIVFISIYVIYQMFFNKKPVITYLNQEEYKETVLIEAGDTFDYMKNIKAIDGNEKDITKKVTYKKMNESELGEHKITYSVEDEKGNTDEFVLNVKIQDTKAPLMTGKTSLSLDYGSDFELNAENAGVHASDVFEGVLTSKIKVEGTVDTKKAGDYPVTFTVEDTSKNKAEFKMTITVKEKVQAGNGYNGPEYYDGILNPFSIQPEIISNPSSITAVVNKYHALPENYAPNDLVTITANCSRTIHLRKEAAQHWEAMQASAKSDGITLVAFSGYRTKSYQSGLFYNYYNQSQRKAYYYSAVPRRSEHELGLALDIGYSANFPENFYETATGKWLANNAHLYGFVLRYPSDKVSITQYAYESWHYRYVGVETATKMKTNNQTLEEYFNVK